MATESIKGLSLLALLSMATAAGAQSLDEGTRVNLSLETGLSYTDNFYYTPETMDQDEGAGVLVKPALSLSRAQPRFSFALGTEGEVGFFDTVSEDRYQDYAFFLNADWKPAMRHRFGYTSRLEYDHDAFGTERSEGTLRENRELDEWRRIRNEVQYQHGLPADTFNLELTVAASGKDYTTNQSTTRFLDHQIIAGETSLIYNYSPKTRVFLNVIAAHNSQDEVAPGAIDRSANEYRYLLGTRWAGSGKTSGDIRLGYVERKRADSRREDFSGLDWRAQVTWSPLATRSFGFSGGRSGQESYLNNVDFLNNHFYSLQWTEDWTERARTKLTVGYVDSEFVGTARQDELVRASLEGEYRLAQRLTLLGQVGQASRDSNTSIFDYDRLSSYLGLRYSN